ncbi:MAG: tyrosine-type recombinase/integrase, partial [Peptococcaceae bacterium]|nr:tyrosine-type recombinase/integrase [Candidatus Syntrophopropionicum ammoniitolerans]
LPYVSLTLSNRQKLNQFRIFLEENEYRKTTIISYHTYVSKFLRSCYYDGVRSKLKNQINEFLENEAQQAPQTFKYCRAALYAYYSSLAKTPFPKIEKNNCVDTIEDLVGGFQQFLKKVKHLGDTTILSEISQVRTFLSFIYQQSPEKFNESQICAQDIRNYFTGKVAHLKPGTKGRIATSIRNFFYYLRFSCVKIDDSIFELPLSPAVWKLNSVPTVLSDEEFKSLANCFDRGKPSGIRDYTIALCFMELGLRCIEVASLTLDDFDWNNSIVNIKNTKTHVDRSLPISPTLGRAIVDYLQNSRPDSENRALFIRFSHTRGEPMGREQVRGAMRRAYKRAGISKSITGTHILRRTVASKIYKKGCTLKMVADFLGHKSLDSTSVYTKLDTEMLLQAAGIWPGGGSEC